MKKIKYYLKRIRYKFRIQKILSKFEKKIFDNPSQTVTQDDVDELIKQLTSIDFKNSNRLINVNWYFIVLTVVGCILTLLRLIGLISWPWVWVTVPFWGGYSILFIVFILVLLVGAIISW